MVDACVCRGPGCQGAPGSDGLCVRAGKQGVEISTFPSADPARAFEIAAFKSHHTVVDAIWGYTQFHICPETRKMLAICSRSGLYEWTRMPFGPAHFPVHSRGAVDPCFEHISSGEAGSEGPGVD